MSLAVSLLSTTTSRLTCWMPTLISIAPPPDVLLVSIAATVPQRTRKPAPCSPTASAGSAEGLALLVGGRPDHQPGPGPEVDPVVGGQLLLHADRDGVVGQRRAGRGHECPVGRLQVLDPPALTVGGQLGLSAAHPGVGLAVDRRVDVAALGGPPDQQRSAAQRDDGRQAGGWRRW